MLVARSMLGSRGRRIVNGDAFRRLIAARDQMTSRYDTTIVLRDVAELAGMSPFHFLRLFSRAFGETPGVYLRRLRLERAKERLARGAAVTDACFDVGYTSLGSFSTLFARRFGRPPSAWRRDVRSMVTVPESVARLYIPCSFLGDPGAGIRSPVLVSQSSRSVRSPLAPQ